MLRSHSDTSSDDMGSQEETAEVFIFPRSGRRSYDCVFCKRGFSTAQALGGHMNIHRRDRAKVDRGKRDGYCAGRNGIHSERCHGSYCPYSRSTASLQAREPRIDVAAQRLRELRFFGADLNLGPKVHGNCRGEGVGEKDGEDGGLDLELRLG